MALIVPIGVAVWTVRSSAKDTAQQIAALEESTQKQVESVKELAKLQIEISKLQMSKELSDARNQYLKTSKKSMNQIDNRHAMLGVPVNEITKIMNKRYDEDIRLALLGAYMLLSHRNLKEFLDIPSPYYFNNVQGIYGYKAIGSGLKGSLMLLVNPEHKYYIEETILYYGLNVVSVKTL